MQSLAGRLPVRRTASVRCRRAPGRWCQPTLRRASARHAPKGTYKDAADHQWLECLPKNAEACDQNNNDDVVTHYCANFDDLENDCECLAQPVCAEGELLGGNASVCVPFRRRCI